MRQKNRRGLALLLVYALLLMPVAVASEALGSDLQIVDTELSHGTTLAKGVFWSATYSDLRQEHYISYQPNYSVTPVVAYGNKVTSKNTLSSSASQVESAGAEVVAGMNGDYYVVNTGVPLGIVVTEGALRSSSSYLHGIGFRGDGTAFIGQPSLKITGQYGQTSFELAGLNKVRSSEGGIYLFTEDFGTSTMNTQMGIDVVLKLSGSVDDIAIGGSFTATVESVTETKSSTKMESGKIVLSVNQAGDTWHKSVLQNMKVGDTVTFGVSSSDSRWSEAEYAMGGLYRLLINGQVGSGLPTGSAPRTAVGTKPDGSVIFYTIDGRQPGYSIGATMTQVAMRLLELGCTDAICLDGGGSTTLGVTMPDEGSMDLINSPSDGSERANSTCFLLVTNAKATGVLGHFYLKPYDAMLLAGANLSMEAVALDTNYHTMQYSGDLSYAVHNGDGVISSTGLFTAGKEAGPVRVSVSAGNATGEATVTVVSTPSTITVRNASNNSTVSSVTTSPGGIVDLTASATYRGQSLVSQNTCYTWSVSGDIGSIDANGRFTAANKTGTGTITVSAGGVSASVSVQVEGDLLVDPSPSPSPSPPPEPDPDPIDVHLVADFESALTGATGNETAVLSVEADLDYVKYGWQSLKMTYAAGEDDAAGFSANFPIESGDRYLTLWIYGDNSGNQVNALVEGNAGVESVSMCTVDFTGWKQVTAQMPEGAKRLTGLTVDCSAGNREGVLRFDHAVSCSETGVDLKPPVVTVSVSGTSLTATITDQDKTISKGRVALTYDGEPISFTLDESAGTLTAAVPVSDGKLHRVALVAGDVSGNLGRGSATIAPVVILDSDFIDTKGHWAEDYAQFLYDSEVVEGIITSAGRTFQPDKEITRAEFAVMLCQWMEVTPEEYSGVTLPFADAASIPDWAVNHVKAMYSLGMIKGSLGGDNVLTFNASGNISRAEVATILCRTLQRGFGSNAMAFSDAASVPSWAYDSMATLTTIGVLSGYQNQVMPTAAITRGSVAKLLVEIL